MHAATVRSHRVGPRSLILPFTLLGLLPGCAPKPGARAPVPVWGDAVPRATSEHRQAVSFQELSWSELLLEGDDRLFPDPAESTVGLEASVEQEIRVLLAGVVGLAVGAGVGALAGPEMAETCDPGGPHHLCLTEGEARTLGAIIGGAVGAGLGLFIAMSNSAATWSPVASAPLGVRARASADGIGVQVSWRH